MRRLSPGRKRASPGRKQHSKTVAISGLLCLRPRNAMALSATKPVPARARRRCTNPEIALSTFSDEAVDQAAVSFAGTAGGRGGGVHRTQQAALLGSLAAEFDAGFGLAVEGLRDGGGSALLAQDKHLDFALAVLLLDAQHVTGADLARGLGALATGGDAAQFAGLGSLLARLEEARRPQPLVDAGAVHSWPPLPPISARSRFQ